MRSERRVRRVRKIRVDSGLNKDMQKKLVMFFIGVLLAFAGLSARLIFITRDKGDQYKKQVLSQQKYESTVIPYKRGDILDCKGNKLATSEKVYNLIIDSKVMNAKDESVEETLGALSSSFRNLNMTDIRNHVTNDKTSQYYKVAKQLTYDEIKPFLEKELDNENYPNIAGVWFEEEYKRVYPNNDLASHVIGFTGKDNVGNYGLEQFYNDTLNGTNGREYGYLNEEETLQRTTIPAVDGFNIVTTIDANMQQIVEKYLYQFNEDNKNAARNGNGADNVACIIMDCNTGDVLAMANYPDFDLNDTRNTERIIGMKKVDERGLVPYETEIITSENYNEVLTSDDEVYRQLNYLWRNYCISNTYEPGSTFKPFTMACGLESGKMTGEEYYSCNGQLHVANHDIKCHNYKLGGCGTLSCKQALEKSCNVSLMLMGRQIGKDTFLEYQNIYGIGLKTNIDLYGESRTASLVFNKDSMGETELATSTFGQGFNVTMIQMISGYCSLINGGYYYEPHVVSKITAADGSIVENISPRVLRQTVSAQTSQEIRDYCEGVVDDGTGKTARPAGYKIIGKTGTAETVPRDRINYVISFMGAAPADNPQIAIYVVIDRPNTWAQDNVKMATTLCRSILTEILPYMNIYMTEELTEKEEQELAELDITIKRANYEEEEVVEEVEDELDTDEEGNIDPHGGDVTSSTSVSAEEMNSNDVDTAPLTGTVLNQEDGSAVKESDVAPYE